MTAASPHPDTFGNIRGEKKGAGSIGVNYADVTREGALVCFSSKGVDKGQAISFPLLFLPLQCFNSVTTGTVTRNATHINTTPEFGFTGGEQSLKLTTAVNK